MADDLVANLRIRVLGDESSATRSAQQVAAAFKAEVKSAFATLRQEASKGVDMDINVQVNAIEQLIALQKLLTDIETRVNPQGNAAGARRVGGLRDLLAQQATLVPGLTPDIFNQRGLRGFLTERKRQERQLQRLQGVDAAAAAVPTRLIPQVDPDEQQSAQEIAQQRLARAAQEAEVMQEILKNGKDYAGDLASAAIVQAQVNAEVKALQSESLDYREALATSAAAEARITRDKLRILQASESYARNLAESAASESAINARKQQILANDPSLRYAQTQASATVTQARLSAQQQKLLAGSVRYQAALKNATLFKAQLNAAVQQQLALEPRYAQELAKATASKNSIQLQEKQALLNITGYVEELAEGKVVQAQLNAAENRVLLENQQYLASLAESTVTKRELAAAEKAAAAQLLAGPRGDALREQEAQNNVNSQLEREKLRLLEAQETGIQEQIVAKKAERAKIENERAARLKAQIARETTAATLEARASLAVSERANKEVQRIIELETILGITRAQTLRELESLKATNRIVDLQVRRQRLEQQLNARLAASGGGAAAAGGVGVGGNDGFGGGGRFGFFGGGARSVVRYGLPAFLLYGSAGVIGQSVREAEELERVFNQIGRQFQSLEAEGRTLPGSFETFKQEVLAIARETGQAADEVARVGFQLQGAFGGNTLQSLRATEQAIQATRVTGLSLEETVDAFTALTQNFTEGGNSAGDYAVSIADVSDKALGLQERLGVLARETISFSSDLAPVAAQVGFTVQELEALGATAQKFSGRPGSALAEAFNRIIPEISANSAEIVAFFQQVRGFDETPALITALRENELSDFFRILARNYNDLDRAQQTYILNLLGGRRETQALVPVLQNADAFLAEFNNNFDDTGKTLEYFNDLQETLSQSIARFGEEFRQLGVQIFEAGLRDFFEDMISIGGDLIDILSTLVSLLSAIGGFAADLPGIGNNLGPLIEGLALLAGGRFLLSASGVGDFISRRGGRTTATGAAGAGGAVEGALAVGATQGIGRASGAIRQAFTNLYNPALLSPAGGLRSASSAVLAGARGFTSALTGAFSPAGWAAIGATIGFVIINNMRQGAQDEIDRYRADLRGPDDRLSDSEIDNLLREVGVDGGLEQLEAISDAAGGRLDDIRRRLRDFATEDASFGNQAREALDFFETDVTEVDRQQAIVDEIISQLAIGYTETLNGLRNDAEFLAYANAQRQALAQRNVNSIFSGIGISGVSAGEASTTVEQELQSLLAALEDGSVNLDDVRAFIAQMSTWEQGFVNLQEQTANTAFNQRQQILTAAAARERYAAGSIGYVELLDALRNELVILEQLNDGADPDRIAEIEKLRAEIRDVYSETLLKEAEALIGFDSVRNADVSPEYAISLYSNLLSSSNLNSADRLKAANEIVSLLGDLTQFRADTASSIQEEIAILQNGTEIPVNVQAILGTSFVTQFNADYQNWIAENFGEINELTTALTEAIIALAVDTGVTFDVAARQLLRLRAAALRAVRQAIAGIAQRLRNLPLVGDVLGGTLGGLNDVIDSLNQAAISPPSFDLDFLPGAAGADPRAAADLARQAAEDAASAAEEARDAARELAEARLDYLLALVENDPVEAARIAQQQADVALRYAENEADRLSAMAQRVRADRQLQEAINEVANSQIELLIAMAEYAGDSVESAELALRLARQQLSQLQNIGAGDAEINQARAEVISAEAAARDAVLSDRRDYYQFLYDMGQITTSQLIGYLQSLMAIPDLTEEQIREIQLQIKGLRDSLSSSDLQFNLPSEFRLPTLYEVRRVNQTGSMAGYQDNRQINVTVYAQTGANPQQIADAVAAQIGEPNRFGVTPRRY